MPTPDRHIDEIRARADAATPGPWKSGPHEALWNGKPGVVDDRGHPIAFCGEGLLAEQDCAFIAGARDDVPWLLDENVRLIHERDIELNKLRSRLTEVIAEREEAYEKLSARTDRQIAERCEAGDTIRALQGRLDAIRAQCNKLTADGANPAICYLPVSAILHALDGESTKDSAPGDDGLCGDCADGRCHGGNPNECGCDRHGESTKDGA